jgi:hypothetical protein
MYSLKGAWPKRRKKEKKEEKERDRVWWRRERGILVSSKEMCEGI